MPITHFRKQPALISKLYSGIQCGSCGLRFPQEQTVKYSQHLDWHFRLNRRGKDGARMIHSRKWYYNSSNWMQFQEMEDNSDRGRLTCVSSLLSYEIEKRHSIMVQIRERNCSDTKKVKFYQTPNFEALVVGKCVSDEHLKYGAIGLGLFGNVSLQL